MSEPQKSYGQILYEHPRVFHPDGGPEGIPWGKLSDEVRSASEDVARTVLREFIKRVREKEKQLYMKDYDREHGCVTGADSLAYAFDLLAAEIEKGKP